LAELKFKGWLGKDPGKLKVECLISIGARGLGKLGLVKEA